MTVEVERKFVCDPDIQKRLKDIAAVCIAQHTFHDQYFDTSDFQLTLKDVWLRCRQGCWELKCPTATPGQGGEEANRNDRLCSRYKEITNLPQIKEKLSKVLKASGGKEGRPVSETVNGKQGAAQEAAQESTEPGGLGEQSPPKAKRNEQQDSSEDGPRRSGSERGRRERHPPEEESWLTEWNLLCFAEFTTDRCSFSVENHVRVDLDQADFGYCVGEIEVLVMDGEEVQSALRKIERTANRLELSDGKKVQGKMHIYLQRFCPGHYAKLISAHVF